MNRSEHSNRPGRESLSKKLGKVARQIKARDGHVCVYCGRNEEESGAHLHLDHLTPRSLGGADVASNLVLACRRCNSARKAMSLSVWSKWAARELDLTFTAREVRAQARRALPAV